MKILLVSLGCDKNLVDSEVMLGMLAEKGYTFTDDETEAEIVVVNTCCFINDAKEESVNTLLEMAELKKTGQLKALIVAGCLHEFLTPEVLHNSSLGTTGRGHPVGHPDRNAHSHLQLRQYPAGHRAVPLGGVSRPHPGVYDLVAHDKSHRNHPQLRPAGPEDHRGVCDHRVCRPHDHRPCGQPLCRGGALSEAGRERAQADSAPDGNSPPFWGGS